MSAKYHHGKTRRSDVLVHNVARHRDLYAQSDRMVPIVVLRDGDTQRVAPKDMVRNMQQVLRKWEQTPVQTQADFDTRVRARPQNYAALPLQQQREIDRRLGILGWQPATKL